jgi:predicted RNase H-like HicB family nuclease
MNKKNLKYPAVFEKWDDGKGYTVQFSDIPSAITEGDNLEEAKEMAKEVLSLCLDVMAAQGEEFPRPSKLQGDDIFYITAELGKSTTYSERHQKSYNKNKEAVLSKKREKELELQDQGYKNFREFLPGETVEHLNTLVKNDGKNRREFLTRLIEREYKKFKKHLVKT